MMNVNRVYVVVIFVNTHYKIEDDLTISRKGSYVKITSVYVNNYDEYIDLESGEKYKIGLSSTFLGEMYINFRYGLVPIREIPDIKFDKSNMSKKRILKTLSNSKLLNKKEDDK